MKINSIASNYSILILSCSKFSDLWSNDLYLFDKFWRNHPNIIISSDGLGLYDVIKPRELEIVEGEMSGRIINALKKISSDYVFLTFDDYFIKNEVNVSAIESSIELMISKNIDYCRFFKNKKVKGNSLKYNFVKYHYLPLISAYEVNFYPSLWKKSALLSVLNEKEDIWKTEVRLTRRMREHNLKGIAVYKANIFPFVDIVRKGKYLKSGYYFIKKNKLFLSDRKTRTIKETIYLFSQTMASRYLPKSIKEIIKEKMRKKGKIYFSDYENTDD